MESANKLILVFIHIEKAAGTTFNYILRNNFLFRHYDVRPYSIHSRGIFRREDFKLALFVNPFIRSISGHSVSPTVNLSDVSSNIKYITLFRDPIKRYLSHFWYWTKKLGYNISFDEFLRIEDLWNFQTKKIAGCEDFTLAKEILERKIWLTGIVEEFDEFLLILKYKLLPFPFDPRYQKENVVTNNSRYLKVTKDLLEKHSNTIVRRNQVDLQLYKFVRDSFYREKVRYEKRLELDISSFKNDLSSYKWPFTLLLDYIYRKLYLDTITGLIRIKRGLSYRGSY